MMNQGMGMGDGMMGQGRGQGMMGGSKYQPTPEQIAMLAQLLQMLARPDSPQGALTPPAMFGNFPPPTMFFPASNPYNPYYSPLRNSYPTGG